MPELKPHELLLMFAVWSLLIFGGGFLGGRSSVDEGCETCEAALDKAIDELHGCERKLLTPDPNECEDERLAERERCRTTIAKIKELRCRICEFKHDPYPLEPNSVDTSEPKPIK